MAELPPKSNRTSIALGAATGLAYGMSDLQRRILLVVKNRSENPQS